MDAEQKHEAGQEHDAYWCKLCKHEAMESGREAALKEMKEKIYAFVAEATLECHDCKFEEKEYCTECEILANYRKRYPYHCEICKDTGEIEVMGGSEADEWGVVDVKRCACQED